MNNEAEIKQDFSEICPNTMSIECNTTQNDVSPLGDINIKDELIEYENAEQNIPTEAIRFVQNIDSKSEFLEIEDSKVTCNLDTQDFGNDFRSPIQHQFKSENGRMDCIPPQAEVRDKDDVNNDKIYYCSKCTFKYDSKLNYTLHLKTQHIVKTDKKLFTCNLCGRESKYKSSIEGHMNKHTIDNIYKCWVCAYETVYMVEIELHVATVHGDVNKTKPVNKYTRTKEKMWKCNFCKYETKRQSNMIRHVKSKHKENKCSQCEYETDCKSELKEHLGIHSENIDGKVFVRTALNLYKCKFCKYETRHRSCIYRHIVNKHDRMYLKKHKCSQCEYRTHYMVQMTRHLLEHGMKPYECKVCNKRFRRRGYLQEHSWTHSDKKRFQCLYCDYKNNQKFFIKIHMRNKHIKPKNKDYKCIHCPYETYFKTNLKRHVKQHLLDSDKEKLHVQKKHKEVKDNNCKYESNCKTNMKQHILNHDKVKCNIDNKLKSNYSLRKHSSCEKKFHCTHCDYKTNYKLYLIVHVNSRHIVSQDKEHRCTKCNYKTNSERRYKKHLKNHLMKIETVFKCLQCVYRTNVKALLKRHYCHNHKNLKPYKCCICGQLFQEKRYLNRHIQLMHTNEKKYNCKECNYKINVKRLFMAHILRNHSSY